jgi:hypothetical protein
MPNVKHQFPILEEEGYKKPDPIIWTKKKQQIHVGVNSLKNNEAFNFIKETNPDIIRNIYGKSKKKMIQSTKNK